MNLVVTRNVCLLAICMFAAGLLQGCESSQSTQIDYPQGQPVQFNHRLHVVEQEMECQDCHRYVLTHRKATLPTNEVCADCHSEALGESPEEAKLLALLETGEELNWHRIYALDKHVYFSHFRHVTIGQIACQRCHGEMKELTEPPTRMAVNSLDMDYCVDCHLEEQASEDCLACHM